MNNLNVFSYVFKYIIIGDSNVGKSCILLKFLNKQFRYNHDVTVGVDFGVKMLELEDKNIIKIHIWDTAGQESFKSIIRSYYRGSIGVLLVYDIGNRDTFNNILEWLNEINKYTISNITCILIGNKSDLTKREVLFEEGRRFANENNMLFIETSARLSININSAFAILTERIYKKIINNELNINNDINGINGIKIGTYKSNNNLLNITHNSGCC